ncbi:DUF6233 domain-containing protein [Streptomyces anthocyanicus]|uniref:DUF6233 domain-containing protein n=1 Tax=Streptomyces anthocyanicus TaxID=68174 RepID=UPI002F90DFAB|nr:DUF6233 domain-containing protein [Streptomyces anthocyanicus]
MTCRDPAPCRGGSPSPSTRCGPLSGWQSSERPSGSAARNSGQPPDWLLETGLNRDSPPVQVHQGDCWNRGKRTRGISLDEAHRAISKGVKPCDVCRPDSALEFLET